jgi:hypothetical protein
MPILWFERHLLEHLESELNTRSSGLVLSRFNNWVSTARNLQWLILSIAGFAGIAAIVLTKVSPPIWVSIAGAAILTFCLGFVTAHISQRGRARQQVVDTGFRVIEETKAYRFGVNPREQECQRRYMLEASANNARLFTMNYTWTGGGTVSTTVTSPGHLLVGDMRGPTTQRYLVFYLGRPHQPGETAELTFTQEVKDESGQFGHFISGVVKSRLRSATLSVALPDGVAGDLKPQASLQIRNRQTVWISKENLNNEIRRVGNKWTVQFDRPRPIGSRLMLEWTYSGY